MRFKLIQCVLSEDVWICLSAFWSGYVSICLNIFNLKTFEYVLSFLTNPKYNNLKALCLSRRVRIECSKSVKPQGQGLSFVLCCEWAISIKFIYLPFGIQNLGAKFIYETIRSHLKRNNLFHPGNSANRTMINIPFNSWAKGYLNLTIKWNGSDL